MQPQPADSSLSAFLEKRYDADRWRNTSRLTENLFLWRFLLTGRELPGWRMDKTRSIALTGTPPLIRSLWRRGESEETISVEVFECASRLAAHRHVVDVLGTIQSTAIERDEGEVGDVAFVTSPRTLVLFARANVVVFVRNADGPTRPLYDAALDIDRHLITRPEPGGPVAPEIRQFAIGMPSEVVYAGVAVPVTLSATDPLDRPVAYSIWSRLGQVRLENGGLIYEATTAGTDLVTAYAVNETAGVATAEIRVDVRPEG
jgi:hypothetical protein